MVLSKSHYPLGRPAASMGRGTMVNVSQQVSELSGPALVQLALQTLARFNFKVLFVFASVMCLNSDLFVISDDFSPPFCIQAVRMLFEGLNLFYAII